MPKTSVAIRLGVEGQADIKRAFDDAGKSGQEAFQGITAEMDKAGREAERLAARINKAGTDAVRNALGGTRSPANDDARAQRELEKRVADLRSAIDPVGAATAKTKESIASSNDLLARGAITAAEHAKAIHLANEQLEEFAKKNEHAAGAAGLNRNQVQESVHVVKAFIDQVAAGAEPLHALEVQGARIVQIFTEGKGGVAGTFKALGGLIGDLLTPTKLMVGATAALGITAAVSYSQFEAQQEKITRAIEGTGRAAGLTLAQVRNIGKAGADAAHISSSEGIGLAAGFVRQGIAGDVTQSLVGNAKAFKRVSGAESIEDAGDVLAKAFADPAKGAAELDKSLGFLDDALQTNLNNLQAQGRLDEARRVLSEAVNKSLSETTDSTSRFGKALDAAKDLAVNFFPKLGAVIAKVVDTPSDADRLKSLQTQLRSLDSSRGEQTGLGAFTDVEKIRRDLQEKISTLAPKVEADANASASAAAAAKRSADAQALANQVGPVVRSILPDILKASDTRNTLELLRQAIADPEVQRGLGVTPGQLQQAYGNTLTKSSVTGDPLRMMAEDAALAEKAVRDYTIAERIETATRREALQVLRQTGDAVKANAAAEIARNAIIAKANDEAKDRADLAAQNLRNASLSPYQAGRQAIIDRYDGVNGFNKDEASTTALANSFKPASDLITSAGEAFKKNIQEAADAFKGSGATAGPFGGLDGARGALTRAPANVLPMIAAASGSTGISASIIAAIGERENGFKLTGGTKLLGSNGKPSSAYGYGQLTNGAAQDVASAHPGFDKYDPSTAVFGSAAYLKILTQRRGGDLTAALNAYGGVSGYAADIYRRAGSGPAAVPGVSVDPGIKPLGLTTGAANASAKRDDLAAYDIGRITKPLKQANEELDAQNASLKVQQANFGKSTFEIKGAAAAQELLNKFISDGVPITADLTSQTAAYGNRVADIAKRTDEFQKRQQELVGSLDGVRGAAREGLGTLVDDLRNGASLGKGLTDVFNGLQSKLISFAEDQAIKALFGGGGTTEGGASGFAGILTGLFGGSGFSGIGGIGHNAAGSYDFGGGVTEVGERGPELVRLPAHSQVIPNQIAFGTPAGGKSEAPQVNVYNSAPGATATATVDQGPSGQHRIRVMVDDALMANTRDNSRGTRFLARKAMG